MAGNERNQPCPCGSGKKYKHCCLNKDVRHDNIRYFDQKSNIHGQLTDRWEVGIYPVVSRIQDTPEANTAVIMVIANGFVINSHMMVQAPATPAAVAELTIRVIEETAEKVRINPREIAMTRRDLYEALAGLLQARNIQARREDSLPDLEAAAQSLSQHMSGGRVLYTVAIPATWAGWRLPEETIRKIFTAAAAYYRAAPWETLPNDRIITARFPGGETWYCSVMGNAGQEYGLVLFENLEDFELMKSMAADTSVLNKARGEMISFLFSRKTELPPPMAREIKHQRWDVAGPAAYPHLMVFNTLAGVFTPARAAALLTLLAVIPRFEAWMRDEAVNEMPPPAWKDEETGVTCSIAVTDDEDEMVGPVPDQLSVCGPSGAKADMAAALEWLTRQENPDSLIAAECEYVQRYRDAAKGALKEKALTADCVNIESFIEFLGHHQGVPVRACTEYDLRMVMYDLSIRKVVQKKSQALSMLPSLRRFAAYLAEHEGLTFPWAAPILDDEASYVARFESFPGGHWWDEPVIEWRGELSQDLFMRGFVPVPSLTDSIPWGDQMGIKEAGLYHELQRRWLIWRDAAIVSGQTDPKPVIDRLEQQERIWVKTKRPDLNNQSPLAVIKAERAARAET